VAGLSEYANNKVNTGEPSDRPGASLLSLKCRKPPRRPPKITAEDAVVLFS